MVIMVAQTPNFNVLPEQLWTSLIKVNPIPLGSIGERTANGTVTFGSQGQTTTQFGEEFTPNEIEVIKKTPFLASAIETTFYNMSPLYYRDSYKNRLEHVEARRYYNFAQRDYVGFLKSQIPSYIYSDDVEAVTQLFQTLYDYGVTPEELDELYKNSLITIENDVNDYNKRIEAQSKGPDGFAGFVNKYITPIATIAGAIAGGPLGAAIGNSIGQLIQTGKIDPVQVALATGTTYVAGGAGGTLSAGQQIAAGAALGAVGAEITGGDPLKGAVKGAISSVTTTTYAQSVGNALGITSEVAARTVGNAIINASLSGVQAALTPNSDIGKSILAGAVTGAVMVNASDVAKAVLGDKVIGEIEKLTNLTQKDVGNIFSNSIVQSVIATINNQDAGQAFINTAISNGVSQSVANSMWNGFQDSFKGKEDVLAGIVTAVQGVADTGVNAALYNQDVSTAIENAIPGILISSLRSYNLTADEMEKRKKAEEERQPTALEFTDLPTLLAGPVSQEALAQTQARELFGEFNVGEIAENVPGIGNIVRRTIQGTRNDGTPYSYNITIYEDGSVTYSYLTNQGSIVSDKRPDLKSSVAGTGDIPIEQQGQKLPLTGIIDLRTFVANVLPTGNVIFSKTPGGVGRGEKSSSGFQFIGRDNLNRERFDVGGINFTVIALDGKNVLVDDTFKVILVPIVNPENGQLELQPDSKSETFNPPQQTPAPTPTPELTPTPRPETTPIAPREEGQTGLEGATGVAGGAPSGPSQAAPSLSPQPGAVVMPETTTPSAPANFVTVVDAQNYFDKTKDEIGTKIILDAAAGAIPAEDALIVLQQSNIVPILSVVDRDAEFIILKEIEQQLDADRKAREQGRVERVDRARLIRTEREQAQYEREQAEFEKSIKDLEADIAKAKSDEEKARARQIFTAQQRERLRGTGRLTGGLQAQIDAELGNLLDQYEDAQRRAGRAVTQKESLAAPQQPGDAGRGISDQDVIDLLGLDRGTAERYGFFGDTDGVAGGTGPGSGLEGEAVGSGVEGDGPGSAEEGVGPGAGDEGFGPGGGAEDVSTRLRPIVIYDQKTGAPRATQGIPQRVTAQAVEGILGDKEPLFGGDEDEQRAIWNRRSLRLRKALGL